MVEPNNDNPARDDRTTTRFAGTDAGRTAIRWIGRWAPAAVTAVLCISSLVALFITCQYSTGSSSNILSAVQVFERGHAHCIHGAELLADAIAFPKDLKLLPAKLASYLGGEPTPSLDLSGLGYDFYAAGECTVPGLASAHMIDQAKPETGRRDSISLWMNRYTGEPAVEVGQIYTVADKEVALLLWRDQTMIYDLVSNLQEHVEQTAQMLLGG